MDHANRRTGRARRALIRLSFALVVLLLPATFPMTAASFIGSTSDDGNSASSAEVAPPAGLAAAQTCVPGPGIALRAASSADGGGLVDTVTVNRPTGTVTGDFLAAQTPTASRRTP
jgi:hypothetical protein